MKFFSKKSGLAGILPFRKYTHNISVNATTLFQQNVTSSITSVNILEYKNATSTPVRAFDESYDYFDVPIFELKNHLQIKRTSSKNKTDPKNKSDKILKKWKSMSKRLMWKTTTSEKENLVQTTN